MSQEAAANGYGTLSYITGVQLVVSFSLVVLFAVFSDEGLNRLEAWAQVTGFQELFQRIYRELMVMGIASFAINIMSASSGGGFGSWEYAYYFSDNIMFLISTFFCFQGIGVMAVSLIEARSWDRASKISTEELLFDVENEVRHNSFSWRNAWYPFNRTRNQVEFRVYKLLFSKVYKIGGANDVFNFGYFLRLSHQRNVISAIDMTPIKWLTVAGLVGLISAYFELDLWSCKEIKCVEEMSVYSFIVFGMLLVIIASILCYVARSYELKLLALVGLNSINDYDIYLQTEERITTAVEETVVDKHTLMDVLAQLAVERDIRKAAQQNSKEMLNHSIFQNIRTKILIFLGRQAAIGPSDGEASYDEASDAAVASAHIASLKTHSKYRGLSSLSETNSLSSLSNMASNSPLATDSPVPRGLLGSWGFARVTDRLDSRLDLESSTNSGLRRQVPALADSGKSAVTISDNAAADVVTEFTITQSVTTTVTIDSKAAAAASSSISLSLPDSEQSVGKYSHSAPDTGSPGRLGAGADSPGGGGRRKSIFDVVVEKKMSESVLVTMQGGDGKRRRHSAIKKTAGGGHSTAGAEAAIFEHHKDFFRTEMKEGENYLKNFRSIFFRQEPEWFYACVHAIMLCNTLYLAWWITTLVFFLSTFGHPGKIFLYTFLSLTPPALIFPLLTLLVRRTTLFKVLMRLDPGVVVDTLHKAQTMSNAISALQQNLKIRCSVSLHVY
jgi:hypothetical protein